MRIGWITSGGREKGNSSRCIAFAAHDWFLKNGIDSKIVWANQDNDGDGGIAVHPAKEIDDAILNKEITHLIFQKVMMNHANYYLNLAKKMGIITIYTVDDWTEPYSKMMELEADIVVTNSPVMEEYLWYKYKREAITIHAAYDVDRNFFKEDYHTERLTAYWYGTLGNQQQAEEFEGMMKAFGIPYEIIAPPGMGTITWRADTFYHDLARADIAVLPCLHPMSKMEVAKGHGRPIQAMILGVPLIVSPFPAYTRLITNGLDGFIAYLGTSTEFKEYIDYLKDEENRKKIGQAGRQRVVDEYHIDTIGNKWLEVLTQ